MQYPTEAQKDRVLRAARKRINSSGTRGNKPGIYLAGNKAGFGKRFLSGLANQDKPGSGFFGKLQTYMPVGQAEGIAKGIYGEGKKSVQQGDPFFQTLLKAGWQYPKNVVEHSPAVGLFQLRLNEKPKPMGGNTFGGSVNKAINSISSQANAADTQTASPTLSEMLLAAAKSGQLNTADAVFSSAAAQAARDEAAANQHISDVNLWGQKAIGEISGAGANNARQNARIQSGLGKSFGRMLGTTGLKGSPLSKLGGINAAEMAANAAADKGWFSRQAATQATINSFADQALRRQAEANALVAANQVNEKVAQAKNNDVANMIELSKLEQSGKSAVDPSQVEAIYADKLGIYNGNTQQARQATALALGGNPSGITGQALNQVDTYFTSNPIARKKLLERLSAGG